MQQLRFVNNTLTQHVSGIILPIFRSAIPYVTAYGFQHLMCWLVSWRDGLHLLGLTSVLYAQYVKVVLVRRTGFLGRVRKVAKYAS